MEERYNPESFEKKWQKEWAEKGLYTTSNAVPGKENYYQLVEFAYPSGNLHVGHWYAFAVPDIHARYQRMKGKNVLYPFGFDAFGLPAENAAIKNNKDPKEWTEGNIASMREQLKSMGAMFDWSRELATCDPKYYRWTQWLFIQLFKAGLVEQKETLANWCPKDKTVLANEQVVNGACERCGTPIEKRTMKEWQLGITKYAERLLSDLEPLDWPEEIKTSQRNWIGKSEGAEITFALAESEKKITVFTTRPDTLFGATYLVLAPEHKILEELKEKIENFDEVTQYIEAAKKKSEIERSNASREKTGVLVKGVVAINPGSKEEMPIYIADYVLDGYGTGTIMAVPAHDERDFEFAKKFALPIRPVIQSTYVGGCTRRWMQANGITMEEGVLELLSGSLEKGETFYPGQGTLINSGEFSGLPSDEAELKITESVGGQMKSSYRLRDWGVSRQRYWGCPIPLVHCAECGSQAVPDDQLPIELPEVSDYLPNDDGQSPLSKNPDFVNTICPKCGGPATRETDTLDTFVDSSWYFLRYCDPKNENVFADKEILKNWLPITFYSGGAEHTTMHLLYSRFFHKALFDLGLVNELEPYVKRMNRSLILGPDGNKMSKSKGNVINPDPIVAELGADTMRMYLAFIGPYNEVSGYPWNPEGVIGVHRFLERVWKLAKKVSDSEIVDAPKIESLLHKTLAAVEESIASFKMNTGVAALMSCANELKTFEALQKEHICFYAQMLAPYAPHIAEELWHEFGGEGSVHLSTWPTFSTSKIIQETISIAVQVNGKMRTVLAVAPGTSEEALEKMALVDEKVQMALEGKEVKKVIVVPGRVVNIVS